MVKKLVVLRRSNLLALAAPLTRLAPVCLRVAHAALMVLILAPLSFLISLSNYSSGFSYL